MLFLGGSGACHISSIQKPSRCYSTSSFFRSRADSFACGANLKLRQANARAQAKVARAHARVCRGLATPLTLRQADLGQLAVGSNTEFACAS